MKDLLFSGGHCDCSHFRATVYAPGLFMVERTYFTCIICSEIRTLYIGVTNHLVRRVFEHKQKLHPGFTARYNCNRLVWFERFSEVSAAI